MRWGGVTNIVRMMYFVKQFVRGPDNDAVTTHRETPRPFATMPNGNTIPAEWAGTSSQLS